MMLSEFIEHLQALHAEHGDLPVVDEWDKEADRPEVTDDGPADAVVLSFSESGA